jgi:hypothetical protein
MKQFNTETFETLKLIKANLHRLTYQQYRTLKGQCLAGDVEGAKKGFYKIIRKGAN